MAGVDVRALWAELSQSARLYRLQPIGQQSSPGLEALRVEGWTQREAVNNLPRDTAASIAAQLRALQQHLVFDMQPDAIAAVTAEVVPEAEAVSLWDAVTKTPVLLRDSTSDGRTTDSESEVLHHDGRRASNRGCQQ